MEQGEVDDLCRHCHTAALYWKPFPLKSNPRNHRMYCACLQTFWDEPVWRMMKHPEMRTLLKRIMKVVKSAFEDGAARIMFVLVGLSAIYFAIHVVIAIARGTLP